LLKIGRLKFNEYSNRIRKRDDQYSRITLVIWPSLMQQAADPVSGHVAVYVNNFIYALGVSAVSLGYFISDVRRVNAIFVF
jgi:hypothetical protein